MKLTISLLTLSAAILASTVTLLAGTYEIPWHTVDGGGASGPTAAAGGTYEVSGAIGQPDATSHALPMSGGTYELVGGFWTAPPVSATCACLGDMNGDSTLDGQDVQAFANCLIDGGACSCADVDQFGGVNPDDVNVFVEMLLNGAGCP